LRAVETGRRHLKGLPVATKKHKSAHPNVYADLSDLIALQHEARGVSFLPRHLAGSPLFGRYYSRLRGRGLNLEELRQYYPGDDIRLMDWKATIRTGKPHVRTYTEERDRPALILVDQRISMFFGSRRAMKSVIAAEMAAIAAWGVISAEDRVGALIFNDKGIFEIRPQRNRSAVLRLLQTIVDYSRQLAVGHRLIRNDEQFNRVLSKTEKLCNHDYLVIIVSDLNGWNETSAKHIKRIARHNDVVTLFVFDPLEKRLPQRGRYVVSDGRLQIEFDTREKDIRKRFSDHFSNRVDDLTAQLKKHNIPVIPVDTVGSARDQIRRAIGERTGLK
jgi:uncharacterized protein (DUF58 family)